MHLNNEIDLIYKEGKPYEDMSEMWSGAGGRSMPEV